MPTYNFGVVVDDLDMEMTHVIRGDDHVNNTPRQINIYRRARSRSCLQFAHVPMILGADGERLSKRHGAVSVMQYRDDGFLPEAMVNYLARLGWSHGDEEMFSREQFVRVVRPRARAGSPARFDREKLAWINQQYLKNAHSARRARGARARNAAEAANGPPLERVMELVKDRAVDDSGSSPTRRCFSTSRPKHPEGAGTCRTPIGRRWAT